jgi:hypothetical protein
LSGGACANVQLIHFRHGATMQNSIRRRRLLQAMDAEPLRAWTVLAKSAAGLAVIALLAVIGAGERRGHGAVRDVAAAVTRHAAQAVEEHRKQVFDERRQRFEGKSGHRSVADGTLKPAYQSPVMLR